LLYSIVNIRKNPVENEIKNEKKISLDVSLRAARTAAVPES